MIATTVVEEIQGLLEAGEMSQRKIARQVGVSRGTVNAIALGRRTPKAARAREDFQPPTGPVARCPTCGGMVRMPCLACRLRAERPRCRIAMRAPDRAASAHQGPRPIRCQPAA